MLAHDEVTDVVTYWLKVAEMRSSTGELLFPVLSKVALAVMSCPAGNAAVERIFNKLADLLVKKGTSAFIIYMLVIMINTGYAILFPYMLDEVTIDAVMVITGYLATSGFTCVNFPFSQGVVQAGLDARVAYNQRLKRQQEAHDAREKELLRKRQLEEQMRQELEQSKQRQTILDKEKALKSEKSELEKEEEAATLMLEEYRRKVSNLENAALSKKIGV